MAKVLRIESVMFVIFLAHSEQARSEAYTELKLPAAGNCGDETVLKCEFSGFSPLVRKWDREDFSIMNNGITAVNLPDGKYSEDITSGTISLTIHNTELSDEDRYKCTLGFGEHTDFMKLKIECKASAAVLTVTNGKKVVITVDKLYPDLPEFEVSFNKENKDVTVQGSRTCSSSSQNQLYFQCVWTSLNSIADGSYMYSLVVTTITKADPLTGFFKIVSPQTPKILNVENLNDNRKVVYGNEGQSLTIQCTSSGGYPTPTVVWYKDFVSDFNQIASASTGTLQGDDTYTVKLNHTFIPTASDDRKKIICRSYYPQADSAYEGSEIKTVILYLTLKPRKPTVTQTTVVSTGYMVEVRCRTTGCRPAANISWSYQGSTTKGEVSSTLNATTETYTVLSFFRRKVTAADNGHNVTCLVTHQALVSPPERTASVPLNVSFGPSTSHISGNKEMNVTGEALLTLTCTTGSANPASYITWKNGSVTLNNSLPYKSSTGENNGVVRSQQLVLSLTRYMDGDVIVCSVSNSVSQSDVVDTITLNLKYSPLVTIQGQQQNTITEGESKELSCKVESKPMSIIKWYHGSSLIVQGTSASNVLNYSLTPINRTHYGNYSCKAGNGIGLEQQEKITITVRFKPLTTIITGNRNVIATGKNTLPLVCISGSSNPISDIKWRVNNVTTQQTGSLTAQKGKYGGMKHREMLTLFPTRDNDGDNISCEANNVIGTSERNTVTLDLRYSPLIEPMLDIVAVEGNKCVLTCVASSKPVSKFEWYKGQSGILQGNGTLGSNKLTYSINKVSRNDAGTYRCNADNGIKTADNENVLLTVYYPPDVIAVTRNTTVKATDTLITCSARGVPNSNYRYGKWTQTWAGNNVLVSEKPGNETLELKNLTYEHSGVYTCSASNGVKVFGTNKEFMEGSVLLVVKSFPIITNVSEKTPARLKENATLEVHYYSNVAGSKAKIYRNVNGSRQEGVSYTVSETYVQVDLPVFTQIIRTGGTRARISIQIQSQDDLGSYDVVVSNEIGSNSRSFEVVPKGPPSKPYNVTVDSIQYNTVRLSWIQGYHGGLAQTFVIQLSTDLNIWNNITVNGELNESLEPISEVLPDLHDSTTYYIRMYAFNKEGSSPFTEILNYTTPSMPEEDKPSLSGAVIGGAAGGISALIIILVIVVVVILKRRGVFTKGKPNTLDDKNDRKPVYVDEDDDGMQDNPMYVSAGPRNQIQTAGGSGVVDGAVYSTVDKNRIVVGSRKNDVYAEVDKSKKTKAKKTLSNNEYATSVKPKGKKEKKEKSKQDLMKDKKGKKVMQEGDLYENATTTEMKGIMARQNKNDETIYENPEPSKPAEKKNMNKDGLIYADITFNDQPKGQKKLVIHGLDSMTEYVEIDFTKKADPLPESDDENNSPKN